MLNFNLNNFAYSIVLTLFFLVFSINGWFKETFEINLGQLAGFLFLIALIKNIECIKVYIKNLIVKNFKSLEFWILLSTSIYISINNAVFIEGLSFLALFVFFNSIILYGKDNSLRDILLGCFISTIISMGGIIFGFIETIFYQTNILSSVTPINYPNPILGIINSLLNINWMYQISGFHLSINYAAYTMIAGMFLANIFLKKNILNKIISSLILICLLLTNAKVAFLFLALFTINMINLKSKFYFSIFIALLYILFCHITIIHLDTEIIDSKYYSIKILNVHDYDIYLSLFAFLKIQSLVHLMDMNFIDQDFNTFYLFSGHDPHSVFTSVLFFAGPIGLLSFTLFLYKLCGELKIDNHKSAYLLNVIFIIFATEAFVWDSFDSPIFWLLILLIRNQPKLERLILKSAS